MENIFAQRVEALRHLMSERGWDAVVITGSDPHGSEYPADRWKQVRWISGFGGEAADMVITADHAGLWTDTRFFIAATEALEGTGIELHKTRIPGEVLIPEWIADHFASEKEIILALDGLCTSAGFVEEIRDSVREMGTDCLVASVPDLLGILWKDRPAIPCTTIYSIDPGESRREKIGWLRDVIEADGILLSSLDEIAWLLNVRASDIDFNPYSISYVLLTQNRTEWFVLKGANPDPGSAKCFEELRNDGVDILPYDEAELALNEFEGSLQIDKGAVNWCLYHAIKTGKVERTCPIALRKAVKNAFEIRGMKDCHIADGIAMEKFLFWLERSVQAQRSFNEADAAEKLAAFKSEAAGYRGESFETISAYGKSAALPHYVTPEERAPYLFEEGLYLVDAGSHYVNGTTDITRTVPLGHNSRLEKEDYTLVLKAHIDLAMAVFPAGTAGCQLDAVARGPLWLTKRNFGHGTGHGVGFLSGVHEGPAEIRQNFNRQALLPGMIFSDEPGIYREGMHGVRHENLLLVVEDGENEFGRWLRFETITMCHFDTSAVVRTMLSDAETQWLNDYNMKVYKTLKGLLPPAVAAWLKEKTRPI